MWGPQGASIAYVFGANIYYRYVYYPTKWHKRILVVINLGENIKDSLFPRETPESLDVMVTQTGRPGVVFNGVADWVYEEEVWSAIFLRHILRKVFRCCLTLGQFGFHQTVTRLLGPSSTTLM